EASGGALERAPGLGRRGAADRDVPGRGRRGKSRAVSYAAADRARAIIDAVYRAECTLRHLVRAESERREFGTRHALKRHARTSRRPRSACTPTSGTSSARRVACPISPRANAWAPTPTASSPGSARPDQ